MIFFMRNNIWGIIPNRTFKSHQLWLLKQCLQSLFDFEPSLAHRIIVCDDLSPDQISLRNLLSKFPVKLIQHKDRVPYAKMINSGLQVMRSMGGEGLLTINNDIEHKSHFLAEINDILERDEKINVIGCTLFYPDGKTQHGGVEVKDSGGPWCEDKFRGEYREWGKSRYLQAVTGAWTFIKNTHLNYDERFPFGFEDVDFCLRGWEAGLKTYYTTSIHHIHHESATRGKAPSQRELDSSAFFRKSVYDFGRINEQIT